MSGLVGEESRRRTAEMLLAVRNDPRIPTPVKREFFRRAAQRSLTANEAGAVLQAVGRKYVTESAVELERAESCGCRVVSILDDEFPDRLRCVDPVPGVLFVRGDCRRLFGTPVGGSPSAMACVAIVGTRKASRRGCAVAKRFAEELTRRGVVVVSGLALGIDSAAHSGAIEGCRGAVAEPTAGIAVLGSGLGSIYPAANASLAEDLVAHGGCLVSEYPTETPPGRHRFPERNRIVSGLCHAVVVVEAGERSGARITARLALEQGREVLAVPGDLGNPGSIGCNEMLKDGAIPVTDIEDILNALPVWVRPKPFGAKRTAAGAAQDNAAAVKSLFANREEARVATDVKRLLLSEGICSFDELAARVPCSAAVLQGVLGKLELAGHVAANGDGTYSWIS